MEIEHLEQRGNVEANAEEADGIGDTAFARGHLEGTLFFAFTGDQQQQARV